MGPSSTSVLLFEGRCSPQLTFVLIVEPHRGALWLQVRGPAQEKERIRARDTAAHRAFTAEDQAPPDRHG